MEWPVVVRADFAARHVVWRDVVRAPAGADVKGSVYLAKPDLSGMVRIDFTIPKEKSSDNFRREFLVAKAFHYSQLVGDGCPGGAWFRHEYRIAQVDLDQKPDDSSLAARNVWNSTVHPSFDQSYELISGGRAVSENLQLDRNLPAAKRGEATVDLSSIEGISTAAVDWSKYLPADAKPKLDPLASAIPEDQHALFFSSFDNVLAVADTLEGNELSLLDFASSRSEDSDVLHRYQRQLGLSMSDLSRAGQEIGAKRCRHRFRSVLSDRHRRCNPVRNGSSRGIARATVRTSRVGCRGDQTTADSVCGRPRLPAPEMFVGTHSTDRRICSYVARLGSVVAVSNSLEQLDRLEEVFHTSAARLPDCRSTSFSGLAIRSGRPTNRRCCF